MLTRLKHTRDALQKTRHELQAVIQTTIDGIITINEWDKITSFDPATESVFGYSRKEAIGKNAFRFHADTGETH